MKKIHLGYKEISFRSQRTTDRALHNGTEAVEGDYESKRKWPEELRTEDNLLYKVKGEKRTS